MTVHHLHDRGYKRLFSNLTFLRQLLESFVPLDFVWQLDFTQCEKINKSYVSEEYRENTSDLLYKIPLKTANGIQEIYICILIEFQSTCPHFMAVRLAHYILNFYLDLVESNKLNQGDKLPAVLPILLYNGQSDWTAPTRLADLIESSELLGKYGVAFQYFPIIEKSFSVAKLKQIQNLVSTLFLADAHYDKESIKTALLELFDHEEQANIQLLISWFLHLVGGGKRPMQDYEEIVTECKTKRGLQTMLEEALQVEREQYRAQGKAEGKVEGKAEGKVEGQAESKREIAKNCLRSNIEITLIAQWTGLTELEIISLREEL